MLEMESVMKFSELKEKIVALPLEEKRVCDDRYVEVVVSENALEGLKKLLVQFFGEPSKPEGKDPSIEDKNRAEPYGGIRKNQTMYFSQGNSGSAAAMLWPWSDGQTVTLKIFFPK